MNITHVDTNTVTSVLGFCSGFLVQNHTFVMNMLDLSSGWGKISHLHTEPMK